MKTPRLRQSYPMKRSTPKALLALLLATFLWGCAVCGNGILERGEGCDDGNTDNDDACPSTCQPAFCGDGFLRAGVEQCDDGNHLAGDGCSGDCSNEGLCGDSILDS